MKLAIVLIVTVLAIFAKAKDLSQYTPKNNYVASNRLGKYNPRIIGGQEANPHSHPHLVALYIDDSSFCSGSIINKNVILTAAHCVETATTVKVVAGVHNLENEEDTQQIKYSTDFTVHKGWDSNAQINDIALIHLRDPLNLNQYVQQVRLDDGDCQSTKHDGTTGTAAGWGFTSNISGINSILLEVKTPIISNRECKIYFDLITDSHICIDGVGNKGGCRGDSGGALLDENNVQVGIASFVSAWGCEVMHPTAYTRVACFKDWIQDNIHREYIN